MTWHQRDGSPTDHKSLLLGELRTDIKWLVKGLDHLTAEVREIKDQLTSVHIRMDRHEGMIQRALEIKPSSERSKSYELLRLFLEVMPLKEWLLGASVVVLALVVMRMPAEVKSLILALLGRSSG